MATNTDPRAPRSPAPATLEIAPGTPGAKAVRRPDLRLEFMPELTPALEATRQLHAYLRNRGFAETEADTWRLVLAEATNNSVLHWPADCPPQPIVLELFCEPDRLEVHLLDRSSGFDWPEKVVLPETESEDHRGLFLITALTDHLRYQRRPNGNCLILGRKRE